MLPGKQAVQLDPLTSLTRTLTDARALAPSLAIIAASTVNVPNHANLVVKLRPVPAGGLPSLLHVMTPSVGEAIQVKTTVSFGSTIRDEGCDLNLIVLGSNREAILV